MSSGAGLVALVAVCAALSALGSWVVVAGSWPHRRWAVLLPLGALVTVAVLQLTGTVTAGAGALATLALALAAAVVTLLARRPPRP